MSQVWRCAELARHSADRCNRNTAWFPLSNRKRFAAECDTHQFGISPTLRHCRSVSCGGTRRRHPQQL